VGYHGPYLDGASYLDDGAPPPMPDAACRDHDPEAFFEKGRTQEAIRVCRRCPHISECLGYAMATPLYGVWGGRSANARTKHGAPPLRPHAPP
jgi:hypothetical protein